MHNARNNPPTTPHARHVCARPTAHARPDAPCVQRHAAHAAPQGRPAAAHAHTPPAHGFARAGVNSPASQARPTHGLLRPKNSPAPPAPGPAHGRPATPQTPRPQPFGRTQQPFNNTPTLNRSMNGVAASRPPVTPAARSFGVQRKTASPVTQAAAAPAAAPHARAANASRVQSPPQIQRPQPAAAARTAPCVQRRAATPSRGVIQPMMDDGINMDDDFSIDTLNYKWRGQQMVQNFTSQATTAIKDLTYMFGDGRNLSNDQFERIYTATHGSISTMLGYFNEFRLIARKLKRRGNVTPQVKKTDMEYTNNTTGLTTRLEAKNINTGSFSDIGTRLQDADVQHGKRGMLPPNTLRKTFIRITAPNYDTNSWPHNSIVGNSSFNGPFDYKSFASRASRDLDQQNLQNTDRVTVHGAYHDGSRFKATFGRGGFGNNWQLVKHKQL